MGYTNKMWVLLFLFFMVVGACGGSFQPDFQLGYRVEPGVEQKGFAVLGGRVMVNNWFALDAGVYGNSGENSGLGGYALSGEFGLPEASDLNLRLGVQHEEWRGWQAGENRAFFMFQLTGLGRFEGGTGIAWRQGVFGTARYQQPWVFSGPAGEWNLLYQVKWTVWQKGTGELGLFLSNINRHQIYNPQMFPFGVRAGYPVAPNWLMFGIVQSAVKGFSAALFSFSPVEVCLGVSYER